MKILIVDDEAEIRGVLRLLLEKKGYVIEEAQDGRAAIATLKERGDIDLVIMDIMMRGLTGVQATRQIREFSDVPILFLTAKSMDRDKASAYNAGGDDYLVKPFSSSELLLKAEALIRRYTSYRKKTENVGWISLVGGVMVDPVRREVVKNGTVVDVRDKELDVLIYLAKNRARTVHPHELYEAVWQEMPLSSSANTVTVHILNLRRKLEDEPASPKIIRTVWGKGYQID